MAKKLQWGLLATGNIAKVFAKAVAGSKTGQLLAAASRSRDKAEAFAQEFQIPRAYGRYEDLLADKEVQAVYISPPHPLHAEWAIKAAEASKHILCEKPLGMNHGEAMAIVEAARRYDVFLMEGFMYRCHPQTARLVELVRKKAIGDILVIQASLSFRVGFNLESRLLNNQLGGGGILDMGCYCASMARLVAGAASDQDFLEPTEVCGVGRIGEQSRVDEYALALLKFPNGIVAELSTGVQVNQENSVRLFGTEGNIFVPSPWIPARDGGTAKIVVQRYEEMELREISIKSSQDPYSIEADIVARDLDKHQASPPAMTWDDTQGNMKTLDRWRKAIGLVYDGEKPEAMLMPVHKRRLAKRPEARMIYGRVAGLDKNVSRLVMGSIDPNFPRISVLFDDFFERGGNCLDTAHNYGGACERTLGQWIKNRNIRKQVVILGKGAHTPWCTTAHLTQQLHESLDRLQTDYLDIYMVHRDNPDVPVGEFVDVLNEHKRAGRLHAFGGSNWPLARIKAANQYAKAKGLVGFSGVSNNLSLARMVDPVWAGCIAASDAESRAWLEKNQFPLFAWSSQARGFFFRGRADDNSDAELVRCWYAEDNFQRLKRVQELAAERKFPAITIALAYVLCQPFPVFALIGPATLTEMRTSFQALDVKLTVKEIRWLNLEENRRGG